MPSRLPHTKSRHGCTRCKQRRVKCDSRQPCSNCVRRREQCSLLLPDEQNRAVDSSQAPSPQAAANFDAPSNSNPDPFSFLALFVPNQQPQSNSSGWSEDLFLMNHYTSSTSLSFSHRESDKRVWQSYAPELAVSHPFLMHGLLAVSALHLSRLRPSNRFRFETQSSHHQAIASSQFRTVLSEINQDNCAAVFCMCALLALISMISITSRSDVNTATFDPIGTFINDVINHFILTRSISSIMAPYMPFVMAGPLRLLCIDNALEDWESHNLPASFQSHFDHLREKLNIACKDDPDSLLICNQALDALDRVYRNFIFIHPNLPRDRLEPAVIMRWMSFVPDDFITLLNQRHAGALVLLAHFVVLFKKLGDSWFLRGTSEHTINMIKSIIDVSTHPLLQWPEEQLQDNDEWRVNSPG